MRKAREMLMISNYELSSLRLNSLLQCIQGREKSTPIYPQADTQVRRRERLWNLQLGLHLQRPQTRQIDDFDGDTLRSEYLVRDANVERDDFLPLLDDLLAELEVKRVTVSTT